MEHRTRLLSITDEIAEPDEGTVDALFGALLSPPNDDVTIPTASLRPLLARMETHWFDGSEPDHVMRAAKHLGIDAAKVPTLETADIETSYKHNLFRWMNLQFLFRSRNLIDDSASELNALFGRIASRMLVCRQVLEARLADAKSMDPSRDAGAPLSADPFRYMPFDPTDKRNAMQDVIIFVLRRLQSKGLRRLHESAWEPIVITDGARRINTRAWQPSREFREMKDACNIAKEDHYLQWKNITFSGMVKKQVEEHLKTFNEADFAPLEPRRDLISFRNGILRTGDAAFFLYDSKDIGSTWVSSNFIDAPFESEWSTKVATLRDFLRKDDWATLHDILHEGSLETPTFLTIFSMQLSPDTNQYFISDEYQNYTQRVRGRAPEYEDKIDDYGHIVFWHYALLGRLLFKLGEKDNWQIIQFFKGVAGCGKSTLLKVAGWFFREEDVETMGNEARKGVGNLQTFIGKSMWRISELKEDFGLSQSTFQSMVSGESVVIDRLFKDSKTIVWDIPGVMAGNAFGGWKDNSGSIKRRVFVSNFATNVPADSKDPLMEKKLRTELPKILAKCLVAYLYLVERYPTEDVWAVAPHYFTWTSAKLAAATDPVALYLTNDIWEFSPTHVISKRDFIEAFKTWADAEKLVPSLVNSYCSADGEKLSSSLASRGCKLEHKLIVKEGTDGSVSSNLKRVNKGGNSFIIGLRKKEEL